MTSVVWRWEGEAFGDSAPSEDPDQDGVLTTVNLRFPGQYYDQETGLHYNWNRYYDPKIGRYVTSDPIGLRGGLNTYSYALNNPLRYLDSDGLAVRFICRYVRGLESTGQKHCFVLVTCPEEGWSYVLSLFSTSTYGPVPYQGQKSLATPGLPDYPDDPRSTSNTDDIPVKPNNPGCASCAFEKDVMARFLNFPVGNVPYFLLGPNSNSFASHLVTSPNFGASAPPVKNAPGLGQPFPPSWQ